MDKFEKVYNFRFEEPGGDQIMTHPRKIEDSQRVKESKRAPERQRKRE